jgi:down-regulator of transcription 1
MDADDDYSAGPTTGSGTGDDAASLPRSTVNKLILESLPANVTCTKECKELVAACGVEFIHLISAEAAELCDRDGKKTLGPDHLMAAIKSLGFQAYLPAMEAVLQEQEVAEQEVKKRRAQRRPDLNMNQEELLRAQEELFAKSRAKYEAAQKSAFAPARPGDAADDESAPSRLEPGPGPGPGPV